MHIDATPAEAQTILKAMRAVAAAGAAITAADRASIVAAARYIFQIELSPDLAGLAPPRPEELKALAARPDVATEAVCFATVMAFVDGTLDDAKFYRANKYAFPGEEEALNFAFAAPHDSSHLLAGYDTSPRGEVLASIFTAAMHRSEAMSGHVLPVIFSWHLGIPLNELAGSAKGALDPQEFWHAWARGERMKVDLFGPDWDFWAATAQPVDAVRAHIGLTD